MIQDPTTQPSTFSRNKINYDELGGKKNNGGYTSPNPNIEPPDAGEWGWDPSATADTVWGRICGEDSLAHPFKTKRSWEFSWRTLSCSTHIDKCIPTSRLGSVVLIQRIFQGWWVRCPILLLSVLAAWQAAHLKEEDAIRTAPHHVDLIPNMGRNKLKQDKGSGGRPAPPIHTQKDDNRSGWKPTPPIHVQKDVSHMTSFKYTPTTTK